MNKQWKFFDFVVLWIGACFCIPSFMLISGLKNNGFSDLDVIIIVLTGSLLIGLLCALLGIKGYRSNLGFTDIVNKIFSKSFARFIILMRGVVCAGWFGINIIILAQTVLDILKNHFSLNTFSTICIIVVIYLLLSILNVILAKNLNIIRTVEIISTAVFLIVILYTIFRGQGTASSFSGSTPHRSWILLIDSILLVFYYWSGLVSNITDYTRNAKSSNHCFWGNITGIIVGMLLVCGLALLSSNKSEAIYKISIWNPIDFFMKSYENIYAELIALFVLFVFMTTTNIVANSYPAIKCFARAFSFDFCKSSLLLITLSILLCPWFIISDFSIYAYYWINLYSLLLIPLIGMMLVIGSVNPENKISNNANMIIYILCCIIGLALYFLVPFLSNFMGMIILFVSLGTTSFFLHRLNSTGHKL